MAKIPTEEKVPNQFPVGLKVLAIDNDSTALENVKQMCNGCHYQVMTYSNALHALDRVRENKDCFDVILIDVHMPNMDGYEFLQHMRKEIDVPVIVMSFDDSTSTKMEAIKHGACDYWKKPLHEEQFRNMWMHVARKAWNENKLETKCGSSLEDDDKKKRGNDDIEATGGGVRDQKRSNSKESDVDEADDCTYAPPAKKPRVIWTENLHSKFENAVTQLGIDNAQPKRILELMNIPGLTRENVASHLQKYRHQLKSKAETVTLQQQNGMPLANTVQTTTESRVGASGRFGFQGFGVTGRVPCETLAMPKEDQWPNHHPQDVTFGHPLSICPPNPNIANAKKFASGYGVWPPASNTVGIEKLDIQENNVLMMDTLQQQRQESIIMHHSVNLQPSCMVVSGNSPSGTAIFHGYGTPAAAAAAAASIPVVQGLTGGSFSANTQVPYGSGSADSLYHQVYNIPNTSTGLEIKSPDIPGEDHTLL